MRRFQWAAYGFPAILFLAVPSAFAMDGWEALRKPGTHALMRHAQAPGTGDPSNFELGNCKTQRNLDESGREQARVTGAAIRAKGLKMTRVLSSQWCRTAETASLLDLGPVEEEPQLNSFFANGSAQARQTAAIIARLKAVPHSEKAILVTHQVNITAITGLVPKSGEITVISVSPAGVVKVVGRIDAHAFP